MATFNILAFDGGPAFETDLCALLELEQACPGFLAATDLFAGVSSGSMVALFLAKYAGTVDSIQLLQQAQQLMKDVEGAMPISLGLWERLIEGRVAMWDDEPIANVLRRPEYFADTTLGELPHQVVITATRMEDPWAPQQFTNFGDAADNDMHLVNISLGSSALPLMLPIRNGFVDGGLLCNNPALAAVTEVVNSGLASLDDIAVMSLGVDRGTSRISNWPIPGVRELVLPVLETFLEDPDNPPEDFDEPRRRYAELVKAVADLPTSLLTEGHPLRGLFKRFEQEVAEHQPVIDPEIKNWGWNQWVAQLTDPILVAQILFTSMGAGTSAQCQLLLGDRSIRVAPSTFPPTNWLLLLLLFGPRELFDLSASFTAYLWRYHSLIFAFKPRFGQTTKWVENHWLSD